MVGLVLFVQEVLGELSGEKTALVGVLGVQEDAGADSGDQELVGLVLGIHIPVTRGVSLNEAESRIVLVKDLLILSEKASTSSFVLENARRNVSLKVKESVKRREAWAKIDSTNKNVSFKEREIVFL